MYKFLPVHTLNNFPIGVCFTSFDAAAANGKQLEAVLPIAAIGRISDRHIFQGDDPSRLLVSGIFKIVQALIGEDEPSGNARIMFITRPQNLVAGLLATFHRGLRAVSDENKLSKRTVSSKTSLFLLASTTILLCQG